MISIIVPVYNSEKYLKNCILSITRQTYRDIEIILVDDGSADSSGKICDEMALGDDRITVIHKKNAGVSSARNDGISAANGKYITFCDSDDTLDSEYCQTLISCSAADNALVMCGYRYSDTGYICRYSDNPSDTVSEKDFLYVYNKELINTPVNKLYRLDLIKENRIMFRAGLDLGEDLIFNLEYMKHCTQMIIINRGLYNYNIHEDKSLSSKYRKNMAEIQKYLLDRINVFIEEKNAENKEEYCRMYLKIINKIMKNNMHIGSGLSYIKAVRQNNRILKNDEYIQNLDCHKLKKVGYGYLMTYKSGHYILISAYLALSKCKRKLMRTIKRGKK